MGLGARGKYRTKVEAGVEALLVNYHRILDKVSEILDKSNGTFLYKGIWFTNSSLLATTDPHNVRYLMNTNYTAFVKGSEWRKQFDVFGAALFNSDGEEWKRQRRIFHAFLNHPQFHHSLTRVLKDRLEVGLVKVLDHVCKQELVVDLQDLLVRYASDIGCILATGFDSRLLSVEFPENRFHKAMSDVLEAAFYRCVMPDSWWKLQSWLQVGLEKKRSDAWNLIRDNVIHFLFAADDTYSTTLTWFFYLLSQHPKVETKIREEMKTNLSVKEVGGLKLPIISMNELNKLPYLQAALCETLRLYPPNPYEFRASTEQDTLPSGHQVNPQTVIILAIHAMGRMRWLWGEDCHEFKPERWITKEGKLKREPPSKIFAFLSGPRICPGKELSFYLMKATASTIILNYDVHVIDGQDVSPKNSAFLHMKHGLMVRIKKRLT
ncbi:hypothetical protein PTKIN_Ptkin02bG0184700 [Pterospermum kingtungense]